MEIVPAIVPTSGNDFNRLPTNPPAKALGTSDPNMVVGYEVPLGCLCVAGEEFETFHFSTAPTNLLTELLVGGEVSWKPHPPYRARSIS